MNYNFSLTPQQSEEVNNWLEKHECKQIDAGAIGGAFSYIFTPTGLGVIEKIRCNICLEILDVSEYDEW